MKCGTPRRFPSRKGGVPSAPETAYRLWSRCVCRRPKEPLRRPRRRKGRNRRAAWCTAGTRKIPKRNELEAAFGKLVIAGRRLVAARANRRRTLARSHGDLDALLVGTE